MTSNSQINLLLQNWQQSFNDRDWDAHCSMFTEDTQWTFSPGTGTLSGQSDLRAALEKFTTVFADIQLSVIRALVEDDLLAVEWNENGTETETGNPANFNFCGIITLDNGLISRVARYGGRQE